MEIFPKKVQRVVGVFTIVFVLSGMFALVKGIQEKTQQVNELQQQNTRLKRNEVALSNKITQLTEQYEALNKEKNGSANAALLTTTKEIFKTVYQYDTSKKSDRVAARREQAKRFANTETLDALFSKDAAQLTPTVTTVSKLEGDPEVYRMSSDEAQLTALVLVSYSLSIAQSQKQSGKFMYKIVFDPAVKQIVELQNVGEISIP